MKIITVSFDFAGRSSYLRLLEVFRYSVQKHMPDVKMEIWKTNPPKKRNDRNTGVVTNTAKLGLWLEAMEKTNEDIILMDCDMLVIGDLSLAFQYEFDIAHTCRHTIEHGRNRIPINGGVMFIRHNERSYNFMRRMKEVNDKMYLDPKFHHPYRVKYAGMNQAAYGYMLEHPKEHNAKILALSCQEWNLCNTEWHLFDEYTKCIHYKSRLRRAALGQSTYYAPAMRPFVQLWKAYETEMKTGQKFAQPINFMNTGRKQWKRPKSGGTVLSNGYLKHKK